MGCGVSSAHQQATTTATGTNPPSPEKDVICSEPTPSAASPPPQPAAERPRRDLIRVSSVSSFGSESFEIGSDSDNESSAKSSISDLPRRSSTPPRQVSTKSRIAEMKECSRRDSEAGKRYAFSSPSTVRSVRAPSIAWVGIPPVRLSSSSGASPPHSSTSVEPAPPPSTEQHHPLPIMGSRRTEAATITVTPPHSSNEDSATVTTSTKTKQQEFAPTVASPTVHLQNDDDDDLVSPLSSRIIPQHYTPEATVTPPAAHAAWSQEELNAPSSPPSFPVDAREIVFHAVLPYGENE